MPDIKVEYIHIQRDHKVPKEVQTAMDTITRMAALVHAPLSIIGYGRSADPLKYYSDRFKGMTYQTIEECYVAFRQQVPTGNWVFCVADRSKNPEFQYLILGTGLFEIGYRLNE